MKLVARDQNTYLRGVQDVRVVRALDDLLALGGVQGDLERHDSHATGFRRDRGLGAQGDAAGGEGGGLHGDGVHGNGGHCCVVVGECVETDLE